MVCGRIAPSSHFLVGSSIDVPRAQGKRQRVSPNDNTASRNPSDIATAYQGLPQRPLTRIKPCGRPCGRALCKTSHSDAVTTGKTPDPSCSAEARPCSLRYVNYQSNHRCETAGIGLVHAIRDRSEAEFAGDGGDKDDKSGEASRR